MSLGIAAMVAELTKGLNSVGWKTIFKYVL
jgi:hypothetical protein